jgi:hypothetical protein
MPHSDSLRDMDRSMASRMIGQVMSCATSRSDRVLSPHHGADAHINANRQEEFIQASRALRPVAPGRQRPRVLM